jgi:hypothetical protein
MQLPANSAAKLFRGKFVRAEEINFPAQPIFNSIHKIIRQHTRDRQQARQTYIATRFINLKQFQLF